MGNKKKLIKKGLINLFPQKIDRLIELFAGSAVVSMNVDCNKIIINDKDVNVNALYNMFRDYSANDIIIHIENRIEQYGLAKECTKRNVYKDTIKLEQYKSAYMSLRKKYNEHRNILDFYTLMFYSFSQQFRFNSNGEFNMPFGNDYFTKTHRDYVKFGCEFFQRESVKTNCADFRELKLDKLQENDFVYCDPPYSVGSTATYNEGRGMEGWSGKSESDLLLFLEKLNSINIKWALSNVFENKGIVNENLKNWCGKNEWIVHTFNSHTYMACGKGNSNAKEVLITNYQE